MNNKNEENNVRVFKTYHARDVANFLINLNFQDCLPISNIMLQRMLYCAQEHYLKNFNIPLFEEEIEAWQFGPVVREVYVVFCGFGAFPIDVKIPGESVLEEEDQNILNILNNETRFLCYDKLSSFIDNPRTSWRTTYDNGNGLYNIIAKDLIKNTIY